MRLACQAEKLLFMRILRYIIGVLAICAGSAFAQESALKPGKGSFMFDSYAPFQDKPIRVWYYNPGEPTQVLMVMHGNSRAAESYRNALVSFAQKHQILLVTPEFDKEQFPSSRDYHQGGIFLRDGEKKRKAEWTFSLIEPLFDYVKKQTDYTKNTYWLYGFSAGSQFVHRYMLFFPDSRASKIVAASAGTYTMFDSEVEYSYGLQGVQVPKKHLKQFLGKDFTVAVGAADTVLSRKDLVKTPIANRQGRDRVERAQHFYKQASDLAETYGVPFAWKFKVIPDVGHSQSQMAPAVPALFLDGGNP